MKKIWKVFLSFIILEIFEYSFRIIFLIFLHVYNKSLAVSSFWRILHSFRISQIAFDIGCFEYLLLHQVIYGSK